jgi:hypothetical protein
MEKKQRSEEARKKTKTLLTWPASLEKRRYSGTEVTTRVAKLISTGLPPVYKSAQFECSLICYPRSRDDMGRSATDSPSLASWKHWLSLRAYGVVTSTLFGATTPPEKMRARFERFGAVSRSSMQRKFPNLTFEDHTIGPLAMESVRATKSPTCVILHLHGGGFVFGSRFSYRNRAMRLSYRCNAEVFVLNYRLAPEHPYPAALDDALAACSTREGYRAKSRSSSRETLLAAGSG